MAQYRAKVWISGHRLKRTWANATFPKPKKHGKFQRPALGEPTVGGRERLKGPRVEPKIGSWKVTLDLCQQACLCSWFLFKDRVYDLP